MKIKDLRITVRELVLGVKGRKKDDVIQVLLRHASDLSASRNGQRLGEEALTYNYEGLRVSYLHSTINFGVRFEAWHLVFSTPPL